MAFPDKVLKCLQHLVVEVTALVNDAVGTLASAQYGDAQHNTDTCISIIVGTGGTLQCKPILSD